MKKSVVENLFFSNLLMECSKTELDAKIKKNTMC